MAKTTVAVVRDGNTIKMTTTSPSGTVNIEYLVLSKINRVYSVQDANRMIGLDPDTTSVYAVGIDYDHNSSDATLTIDLANETAQAGWTNDGFGVANAISDILSWIGTYSGSSTPLATEATLASVLSILQQGKDWEGFKVRDTGNSDLIVRQTVTYDQNAGTYSVSYFELDGTSYSPVGPLEYLDAEAEIAVLNTLFTSVIETNDDPSATDDFLNVGGIAVDPTVSPSFTLDDSVKLRIDKDNGGLIVNQANLRVDEDTVESVAGPSNDTTNVLSKYRATSGVNNTGVAVKASAGTLYRYNLINLDTASDVYFKFYDKATAPTSGDTPVMTLLVPQGEAALINEHYIRESFTNGIGIRCVTGSADADTTSPGTDPIIELRYL